MAPRIFVAVDTRRREAFEPKLRCVDPDAWCNMIEHFRCNSDVSDPHFSAVEAAREQRMTDLATKKRHRFCGVHGDSHHGAGCAIDPARQIDRVHARCRVGRLDHGAREAFDWAIEAGAEQRIDDDLRRHQTRWRGRG